MTVSVQTTWIVKASVKDQSGALTSIASAFSNQGINLDAAVAFGAQKDSPNHGQVAVAFQGTEAQKEFMIRRIQRLHKVTHVELVKEASEDLKQVLFELATSKESR